MAPVCITDGISALMAHLFWDTSKGEVASVTTMTCVKSHLLFQIKISVVQVDRGHFNKGEGCVVRH